MSVDEGKPPGARTHAICHDVALVHKAFSKLHLLCPAPSLMCRRLAYETEVNDALKRHIHSLEEAHKLRETDWHGLAEKWRKYEEDTINENHR